MSFEIQNFDEDVIDASRDTPVLVDFWAPWCGPCRVLGPVLEKLASESDAAWKLAKINTDQHPEVSMRYGIRGIPAVKLFVDGEVVDEFTGALPEYAVRQWLDKALPSETKQLLAEAEQLVASGEAKNAVSLLERVLERDESNPNASVLLSSAIVWDDPERAKDLARSASLAEPAYVQLGESVKEIAQALAESDDRLPEGEGRAQLAAALSALRRRDFDAAVASLLEVIQKDRYYYDDRARKLCIALFNLLGPANQVTKKYRRLFDMALY